MLYLRHKGKPLVAKIIHKKYAKLSVLNTLLKNFRKSRMIASYFRSCLLGKMHRNKDRTCATKFRRKIRIP